MVRVLIVLFFMTAPVFAQSEPDPAELANVRAELSQLYAQISALRTQLAAEPTVTDDSNLTGQWVLRLDRLEEELAALTGQVEQLTFRIQQIVEDGTTRIADLEFRLVELEGGDVSLLGDTPMLGGDVPDTPKADPAPQPQVALAVTEEADFDAAQQALGDGEHANAVLLFAEFLSNYPGGPMSARAMYHLGEAQEALGHYKDAARSYLDSFTAEPKGAYSAQALMRVGTSLAALGKVDNACQTLAEVAIRYPSSDVVPEAQKAAANIGCS